MRSPELEKRVKRYASERELRVDLKEPLGDGTDGIVVATDRNSAIKALRLPDAYSRELRAYQRLKDLGICFVDGLTVPSLIDHDDHAMIVEMDIVQPPYLIDFGKAYTDESSPYDEGQLAQYRASLAHKFRKEDLPRVRKVCGILAGYGIEYLDASPWNIRFRTEDEERELPDDDWDAEPSIDEF
jgi:hypothetical protein